MSRDFRFVTFAVCLWCSASSVGWGQSTSVAPKEALASVPAGAKRVNFDPVLFWNDVALTAVATDHSTPSQTPEQGGPTRTSRALAMVHLAMFDAANSIRGDYESYQAQIPLARTASYDIAVSQAAYETLMGLYPRQVMSFSRKMSECMPQERNLVAKYHGMLVGSIAAKLMLWSRAFDGSTNAMTYAAGILPGEHRPDPLHPNQGFHAPQWGRVKPFGIRSAEEFKIPPPPALASSEYAAAFNEVKRLGSVNSTARTPEQTIIGIYWGYDGTIGLGTPPRLYNQVARTILALRKTSSIENARILALVNMSMADAGIACWNDKYRYSFWRPIVAIREANEGTGPTGLGDGNSATVGDPNWIPLGAPASNRTGTDFTPPFPAYASGHATFGAATFHMLRLVFNSDRVPFDFVSDEFNGVTTDAQGHARPRVSRRYNTLSQAIEENARSRIYLGIHWAFDATAGVTQGTRIADYLFAHELTPRSKKK